MVVIRYAAAMRYIRISVLTLVLSLSMSLLAGCGGRTSSTPLAPSPSPSVALVSDNQSGAVLIVDAAKDAVIGTVQVASPAKMVSAGGITVIQNNTAPTLAVFNNISRTITATVTLSAIPVDVAISPSGKTAWAAESNGTVEEVDTLVGSVVQSIPTPGLTRLVMAPQGTWIMGFSDGVSGPLKGVGFYLIKPGSSFNPLIVGNPAQDVTFNGLFASDDNDGILLSCGAECSGTSAGVSLLIITPRGGGGPGITLPVAVAGATVAFLNNQTLYVAGTPPVTPGAPTLNSGTLQVVDTVARTAGSPFSVADGLHLNMALSSNGMVYIGSSGCTTGPATPQNQVQGCLSVFNSATSSVSSVLVAASRGSFDVTALLAIPGRNVMYVCQGGALDILDTTTNAVSTSIPPISVSGKAFGLVLLQP